MTTSDLVTQFQTIKTYVLQKIISRTFAEGHQNVSVFNSVSFRTSWTRFNSNSKDLNAKQCRL